jgi:hypothetical protein
MARFFGGSLLPWLPLPPAAVVRRQVEGWKESQLSDVAAKLVIYRAFIESDLEPLTNLADDGL